MAIGAVESENVNFKLEDYYRFEVLPKKKNGIVRIQSLGILSNQLEVVYGVLPDAKTIELEKQTK